MFLRQLCVAILLLTPVCVSGAQTPPASAGPACGEQLELVRLSREFTERIAAQTMQQLSEQLRQAQGALEAYKKQHPAPTPPAAPSEPTPEDTTTK
jgi:hypothetical protein